MSASSPRLSLRLRLWSIVGLAFFYLAGMTLVDRVMADRLVRELDSIQDGYVPLLRYGPAVQAAFEKLRRGMQDAVTAEDLEALHQTRQVHAEIQEMLENPPAALEPARVAELEEAFSRWTDAAYSVSEALIRGEMGQAATAAIKTMQREQQRAWSLLGSTVFLDEAVLARGFDNVRSVHRSASTTLSTMRLVLLGSIALMMALIGRRVLRAFAELGSGFERFGNGEFERPVAIGGNDELAALGTAANNMAAHIDELQRGSRNYQAALEDANRELEAFSYSVSHDLRAPLRAIDGFSQALLEDQEERLDDDGKKYLHRVRAAAQRMGELIDDLLTLARIGRATVRRDSVSLSSLARRVASQLEESGPGREVEWVIAEGVTAEADERLVTVALENLLGNAFKFTSKQPQARIEFGEQIVDDELSYFVRDNGAGFDMKYADRLFGAFQRLHGQAEFEGTGVGLATVKRIVRKHRGRIWAEAAIDSGATFSFTLSEADTAGHEV